MCTTAWSCQLEVLEGVRNDGCEGLICSQHDPPGWRTLALPAQLSDVFLGGIGDLQLVGLRAARGGQRVPPNWEASAEQRCPSTAESLPLNAGGTGLPRSIAGKAPAL